MAAERAESIAPHRDRLGRSYLHKLGIPAMVQVFVRAGCPFAKVPGEYWALDVDDRGISVAEVSCTCGYLVAVEAGNWRMCRIHEPELEDCGRAFVFTGEAVYVLNGQPRSNAQTAAAS